MQTQLVAPTDIDSLKIRLKTVYNGEVMVTHVRPNIYQEELSYEKKDICRFEDRQFLTMNWVDEEGALCTISSQNELDEAIRRYKVNKDSKLTNDVFPSIPQNPEMPWAGERQSIYRRGARRWRDMYKVNCHIFQEKRFNRRGFCEFCRDRICGLDRQGFKCINCKLLVHKKCHKLVNIVCNPDLHHNVSCGQTPPFGTLDYWSSSKGELNPSSILHSGAMPSSLNKKVRESTCIDVPPPSQSMDQQLDDAKNIDDAGDEFSPGEQRQYSLSDFNLLRVIGRGSYAKVLMVELKKNKHIYAMKVIKKELVTEDIYCVQTEKHVFEMASNHPFLVGLHSCFQTPSRLFFVIEFVRGGDLMFLMQKQQRLPEEHACFYAAEICIALNFLHVRGIIYRDLKLDNVLVDHEGHIKLTDYGTCKEGMHTGNTTSSFCGTPNYIAPEMLRGEDYGYSVDWWALGVLMYEMLAGRSPFDAAENPDPNIEDFLFQEILEKTIHIPRWLSVNAASVLKGFLNKNPTERLGCHSGNGFYDIINHSFFKSIDWKALEQKQIPPPFKPQLENERDIENFHPKLTSELVALTVDNPSSIEEIDQSEFDGFEYVNPLLMSME